LTTASYPLLAAGGRIPEEKARFILVMRTAAQLNVVGCRDAAHRVWHDVVELEKRDLLASPRAPNERATSLTAATQRALRRYVTP
jgi:hypothetical protein